MQKKSALDAFARGSVVVFTEDLCAAGTLCSQASAADENANSAHLVWWDEVG